MFSSAVNLVENESQSETSIFLFWYKVQLKH